MLLEVLLWVVLQIVEILVPILVQDDVSKAMEGSPDVRGWVFDALLNSGRVHMQITRRVLAALKVNCSTCFCGIDEGQVFVLVHF